MSRTKLMLAAATACQSLSTGKAPIAFLQLSHSAFISKFSRLLLFIDCGAQCSRVGCANFSSGSSERSHDSFEKSVSKLSHESVIFVLKKLGRTPKKAVEFFMRLSGNGSALLSPTACNIVLQSLACEKCMSDFWLILDGMASKGYVMDKDTYVALLSRMSERNLVTDVSSLKLFYKQQPPDCSDEVAALLVQSDFDSTIRKKLEDMKPDLTMDIIVKVLRALHLYPSRALSFFRWVQEFSDFTHNSITYNAILRVLVADDTLQGFWDMVGEMENEGYMVDYDTYVKLLRLFLKRKKLEDAVKLFELMVASPYKPPDQDCSMLLRQLSLGPSPDMNLVFRVVRTYQSSGFSLSKAIYDGIHRSLTSLGKFDEAENILETMKSEGFEPDNITYGQTVFGLCKFGKFDEAIEVMEYMESNGCPPDVLTWTVLIQGFCSAGEVDKALSFFTDMIQKNCPADAYGIDVLINALLIMNRVESAHAFIVETVQTVHLRPWQATRHW